MVIGWPRLPNILKATAVIEIATNALRQPLRRAQDLIIYTYCYDA
jgi:hypothetical protein